MTPDIDKYLAKILDSTEFKNSAKYQKLLEYLVKSTLSGQVPKEVTIAYDVYNIESDNAAFGESNIRVYVYSLRKKLDLYYASEGKDDKVRFVISKGAYKVEFIEKRDDFTKLPKSKILIFSIITVLFLGNITLLFLYFGSRGRNTVHSEYIWKDFIQSDLPLLVVVGDYYLVKDNSHQNRVRYIRDSRINTDPDFTTFMNEFPQYQNLFYKSKHTVLGKFAPFCISELSELLSLNGKSFDLILASDFQWHNIQNYNIIYVGSFKSLGLMKELLKNSNFEFKVVPNELKYHQIVPDSLYYYYSFDSDVDNAYESDYSIVTRVPGTDGTNILFFLSTRDIGLIATVKYFTDPLTLNEFEHNYFSSSKNSPYFESCFKILGLQRNTRSIDLLHVNLNSSTYLKDTE